MAGSRSVEKAPSLEARHGGDKTQGAAYKHMLYQSDDCYSGDRGRPAQAPATPHRVLICLEPWIKTELAVALYLNGTVCFGPKADVGKTVVMHRQSTLN